MGEIARWWKENRAPAQPLRNFRDVPGASDTYIALVPNSGIAGISSYGTGSGSAGSHEIPNYADCTVWKIGTDGTFDKIGGLRKRVYNLGTNAIAADSWILVCKDKFGNWIATNQAAATSSSSSEYAIVAAGTGSTAISPITTTACGTLGTSSFTAGTYYCHLDLYGLLNITANGPCNAFIQIRKTGSSTEVLGTLGGPQRVCAVSTATGFQYGQASISGYISFVPGDVVKAEYVIDGSIVPLTAGTIVLTGELGAHKI